MGILESFCRYASVPHPTPAARQGSWAYTSSWCSQGSDSHHALCFIIVRFMSLVLQNLWDFSVPSCWGLGWGVVLCFLSGCRLLPGPPVCTFLIHTRACWSVSDPVWLSLGPTDLASLRPRLLCCLRTCPLELCHFLMKRVLS